MPRRQPRRAQPPASGAADASQMHERPEKELERDREAEHGPATAVRSRVRQTIGDEQAEDERQMGGAHLADHRAPERCRAVDAPVADADRPQRGAEAERCRCSTITMSAAAGESAVSGAAT